MCLMAHLSALALAMVLIDQEYQVMVEKLEMMVLMAQTRVMVLKVEEIELILLKALELEMMI